MWEEEAEHEVGGTGSAGGEGGGPAVGVELLADGLEGWPASSTGAGDGESEAREPFGGAQVGGFEWGEGVVPEVAGETGGRLEAAFGEMPVPLCPGARLTVREIERVRSVAALPAVVVGGTAVPERIGVGRGVAYPAAADGDRVDVERQDSRL